MPRETSGANWPKGHRWPHRRRWMCGAGWMSARVSTSPMFWTMTGSGCSPGAWPTTRRTRGRCFGNAADRARRHGRAAVPPGPARSVRKGTGLPSAPTASPQWAVSDVGQQCSRVGVYGGRAGQRSSSVPMPPVSRPIQGMPALTAAWTSQTASPIITQRDWSAPVASRAASIMSGAGLASATSAELITLLMASSGIGAASIRSSSSCFALVPRTTAAPRFAVARSSAAAPGSARSRPRYGP